MSINSMLSIGKDSLLMNQHALTIVADNIANMNVEGYSKQRIEQETIGCNIPIKGTNGLRFTSMGARIADITRYCNSYLDGQIRDGSTELAFFQELQDGVSAMEDLLNELNGNNGLATSFSEFYSALNDMASNPTDLATRAVVVQKAQNIAVKFNQYSDALTAQRTNLVGSADNPDTVYNSVTGSTINKINDLLSSLAETNLSIINLSTSTTAPNNLLDKQNAILEELSQYMPVEVVQNNANNTFTVSFNGQTLVKGGAVKAEFGVEATADANNPIQITLTNSEGRVSDVTEQMNTGKIGALLTLGSDGGDFIGYSSIINDLNTLANEFAKAFNDIQTYVNQTDGTAALSIMIDADGNKILRAPKVDGAGNLVSSNSPIFDSTDGNPITAGNIKINADILKDPYGITAAYGTVNKTTGAVDNPLAVGDTRAVLDMFAQRDVTKVGLEGNTFETFMTHITSELGVKVGTIESFLDTKNSVLNQLTEKRTALGGVNLDEELADLVKYQRAYEASARIFNVASEVMSTMINLAR